MTHEDEQAKQQEKRLVIVTGLSGSGKSIALNALEDIGFYCIDNIPSSLLHTLARELQDKQDSSYQNLALGIDVRTNIGGKAELADLHNVLASSAAHFEIIFLQADDQVLIQRFSETRRHHPLASNAKSLHEAIEQERTRLQPLREQADLSLDTTHTNVHQLREMIRRRVGRKEASEISLAFQSFGFKHGSPNNADYLFDVRCLPNPHWHPELRKLTGKDDPVISYLNAQKEVSTMAVQISKFLENWLPLFKKEGRLYLTTAIGCTGGQHRSVYLADRLATEFNSRGVPAIALHRELGQ